MQIQNDKEASLMLNEIEIEFRDILYSFVSLLTVTNRYNMEHEIVRERKEHFISERIESLKNYIKEQ